MEGSFGRLKPELLQTDDEMWLFFFYIQDLESFQRTVPAQPHPKRPFNSLSRRRWSFPLGTRRIFYKFSQAVNVKYMQKQQLKFYKNVHKSAALHNDVVAAAVVVFCTEMIWLLLLFIPLKLLCGRSTHSIHSIRLCLLTTE